MTKHGLFGVVGMTMLLAACGQAGDATKTAEQAEAARGAILLIDGSSTVYPISEALGEEFQKTSGRRVTVGLSGTGGGFKKFCRGEIDIAGASRPIKAEEAKACAEAGIEFIGYLGLAYVTENAGKVKAMPIRQKDGTCVAPSVQTARDASYQPLSRPLFYYVNKKHADERPHGQAFSKFAFDPVNREKLVAEVG